MLRDTFSQERVYLYDTTLRDGGQTSGIDFSVRDKNTIARWLDLFGFPYVEGGWPGANPTDTAFFDEPPTFQKARLTAFGMTCRVGVAPEEDESLLHVLRTEAPAVCLVGKSSAYHVAHSLGTSLQNNLKLIADTVAYAKRLGKEVLFDAEHFFDGAKADEDYALACLKAAFEAGADWLVLCETNGGALPSEVAHYVAKAKGCLPSAKLGFHGHNDMGLAVANSLAAVEAGCRMVQGTLNGLGERCGNANLVTLLPILKNKMGFDVGFDDGALYDLTELSRAFDRLLDREPDRRAPFVGQAAFTHKGGLHASAVVKNPDLYEHMAPETVGNQREILMSNQAGLSNVRALLDNLGIEVEAKDPRLATLLTEVKNKEASGYAFDHAPGSFGVLALKVLGMMPSFFELERFSVNTDGAFCLEKDGLVKASACIELTIGGEVKMAGAEGNGPVHALDRALRRVLAFAFPALAEIELTNYHVRILDSRSATAATTRVLLETVDKKTNTSWTTVGVSTDIIRASLEALIDSYLFRLACVKENENGSSRHHSGSSSTGRKYRDDRPRDGELRAA